MVGRIRCSRPRGSLSGAAKWLLGRDRPDEAGELAGAGDDDLLVRLAAPGHPLPAGVEALHPTQPRPQPLAKIKTDFTFRFRTAFSDSRPTGSGCRQNAANSSFTLTGGTFQSCLQNALCGRRKPAKASKVPVKCWARRGGVRGLGNRPSRPNQGSHRYSVLR